MPDPNRLTRGSAPNRAREPSQRLGTFKLGHPKMGGRKHGTPNAMTPELKKAIVRAAFRLGSDGKGKDGIVGYLAHIAKNDTKTFVMLLRAVLPLQVKARSDRNWPMLDFDGKPYVTADGEPRYPTTEEVDEDLRRSGLPVNLIKLNFVQLLRSKGLSPAEAMRHAGLNSRLEEVPWHSENYQAKDAAAADDAPHTNPPTPSTKESDG